MDCFGPPEGPTRGTAEPRWLAASGVLSPDGFRWTWVCIDITDLLPGRHPVGGHAATFIGEGIDVDDVAAAAGTIGYEILTHLGPRCHLIYRGA